MVLSHLETIALQALRAPGGMSTEQARERWPGTGTKTLHALVRAGLVAHDGERFTITEAGRAACPFSNPILAAQAAGKPKEEKIMPTNKITRSDVFHAICAAGPDGTTAKDLAAWLSVSDQTIFNHLKHLTNEPGAVVRRPCRGLLVASRFLGGTEESAPAAAAPGVDEDEVAKIAREYDEMIDFDLEAAQSVDLTVKPPTLGEAASLAAVNKMLDALPKLGSEDSANRPETEEAVIVSPIERCERTLQFDLVRGAEIDIAVWASGAMTIVTDEITVEFDHSAVRKLRDFLGLFAEAA